MLMRSGVETLMKRAEKLLPQIDSIFCGTLSGKKARVVLREGESVLVGLTESKSGEASINDMIESLTLSIRMAEEEIVNEKPQ